jgi:hypothetical protein
MQTVSTPTEKCYIYVQNLVCFFYAMTSSGDNSANVTHLWPHNGIYAAMHKVAHAVNVFGSLRITEENKSWQKEFDRFTRRQRFF